MNERLKHLQSIAITLAVALLVPTEISATPFKFGFEGYTQPISPDNIYGELLLIHCCHSRGGNVSDINVGLIC